MDMEKDTIEALEQKFFYGGLEIKYLYKKSPSGRSKRLIIGFSAFPGPGNRPKYNYMNTVEPFDTNQLFILDEYGEQGCYYLGEAPEYKVEKAVLALIDSIRTREKISGEDVMCIGSSKGGVERPLLRYKIGSRTRLRGGTADLYSQISAENAGRTAAAIS